MISKWLFIYGQAMNKKMWSLIVTRYSKYEVDNSLQRETYENMCIYHMDIYKKIILHFFEGSKM